MNRHNQLQKEITQRLNISERTGDVITNWTPNNVKSLVIGADTVWVRYHVTGGKVNKLHSIVQMPGAMDKDVALLHSEKFDSYKPVLKALINPRVCSAIEEIVFCTEGYPQDVLTLDTDLKVLLRSNMAYDIKSLLGRFPRLRSVTLAPVTFKEFHTLYENNRKAENDVTLCELLTPFVAFNAVAPIQNSQWYTQKPRKSDVYTLDADDSTLLNKWTSTENRLLAAAQANEEAEKQKKLAISRAIEPKSMLQYTEKQINELRQANTIMVSMKLTLNNLQKVYANLDPLTRHEWGYVLNINTIGKLLVAETTRQLVKASKIDKIDFKSIFSVLDGDVIGLQYLDDLYTAVNIDGRAKSKQIPCKLTTTSEINVAEVKKFVQRVIDVVYSSMLKAIFLYHTTFDVKSAWSKVTEGHAAVFASRLYITKRESELMNPINLDIPDVACQLSIPYGDKELKEERNSLQAISVAIKILTELHD